MDEIKDQDMATPENDPHEEEELEQSHTDKLVGLFTEPGETFKALAKFEPKTVDWIVPILILAIISVIAFGIQMSDSQVEYEFVEKALQKARDAGNLQEGQEDIARKMVVITTYIGNFIMPWVMTFFSALIYLLLAKFALGGKGGYKASLVALSLPSYIMMLGVILTAILTLATGKFYQSMNLADILSIDLETTLGKLLTFADVFAIWYFVIVSIAYEKLFGEKGLGAYLAMVFGFWFLIIAIMVLFVM